MLNFLLPVSRETDGLVPGFIDAATECTDVPFGVLIHISGPRLDFPCVESVSRDTAVRIVHDKKPLSFADAFCALVGTVSKKHLIALAHPSVRLDDEKWFGKVQRVFMLDQHACLITTDQNTRATATPPSRRLRKAEPWGCSFAVMRNVFEPDLCAGLDENDVVSALHNAAFPRGGFVWHHGGVRYTRITCPERSEDQIPSKLRSLTTPS